VATLPAAVAAVRLGPVIGARLGLGHTTPPANGRDGAVPLAAAR
jgi:hypothetical protein